MKLISSILLILTGVTFSFLTPKIWARDIILVENQASSEEGALLVKILNQKFNLPLELITLKNTTLPCEKKSEAIVHLCLRADGELDVKKINHYVVSNSLGVFLNQSEKKYE